MRIHLCLLNIIYYCYSTVQLSLCCDHLSDAVGDEPNHENPRTHLHPGYNHRSPDNSCSTAVTKEKNWLRAAGDVNTFVHKL